MEVRLSRAALMLCVLLASCSAPRNSASVHAGFYRYSDEEGVYYVMPSMSTVCAVTSPAMMWAYGGFSQVNIVDHNVDFRGTRQFAGNCPWPTGNYRNIHSAIVYHIGSGSVCRVFPAPHAASSEAPYTIEKGRLAVRVVPPDANLLSNVKFIGACHLR